MERSTMLLMGKSTINGPFSMAMLVYQRVTSYWKKKHIHQNHRYSFKTLMFTTAFSKTTVLVESQRYSGKPTFYKDHEVTPGFREPTCSSQAKDIVINCRGMPTLYLTYIYIYEHI